MRDRRRLKSCIGPKTGDIKRNKCYCQFDKAVQKHLTDHRKRLSRGTERKTKNTFSHREKTWQWDFLGVNCRGGHVSIKHPFYESNLFSCISTKIDNFYGARRHPNLSTHPPKSWRQRQAQGPRKKPEVITWVGKSRKSDKTRNR